MAKDGKGRGFTDRVLAERAERIGMREAMLGAIAGNFGQFGVRSVDFGDGNVFDFDGDEQPVVETIEAPLHALLFRAPFVGTLGPNPWGAWRELPVERRVASTLLREIAPSALLLDDVGAYIPWFQDTAVVTPDPADFGRLVDRWRDLLPPDQRAYVSIYRTVTPVTPEEVSGYRAREAEIEALSRELDAVSIEAEAASSLKQAGRFLVMAAATGAASRLGLTEDILAKVDGWASAASAVGARKKSLAAKLTALRNRQYRSPALEVLHYCDLEHPDNR